MVTICWAAHEVEHSRDIHRMSAQDQELQARIGALEPDLRGAELLELSMRNLERSKALNERVREWDG